MLPVASMLLRPSAIAAFPHRCAAFAGLLPITTPPSRSHTGYIPFEGRVGVIDNEEHRFIQQHRLINLQPVKKVTVSLDPFHSNAKTIRDIIFILSSKRIRSTNAKCFHKTEVIDHNKEPQIVLELKNGKTVIFKAATMVASDVLYELNKIVLPLVVDESDLRTKASKVSAAAAASGAGKGTAKGKGKKGKK